MDRRTQIEKVRRRISCNRVYIGNTINLTAEEQFAYIVECGCLFLEKIYGKSAPYEKHKRSKEFWSWYRLQWYGVEDNFINYLENTARKRPEVMVVHQYQSYMEFFCLSASRIDEAFKNYLKTSK